MLVALKTRVGRKIEIFDTPHIRCHNTLDFLCRGRDIVDIDRDILTAWCRNRIVNKIDVDLRNGELSQKVNGVLRGRFLP